MTSRTPPRLAWFTPLPPVRSGIAQYNAELLPGLASRYTIDVFVDGQPDAFHPPGDAVSVRNAHDFLWMHGRRPYDLVVYQLGNGRHHDYMWGYLARYPGLVVLHDGQLHQARGLALREQGRHDDYEEEFHYSHPDLNPAVLDLAVSGRLFGAAYVWPMRRVVVASARVVAVHNQWLAEQLRDEHPATPVRVVEMGVPPSIPAPGARQTIRERHSLPQDAMLFTAFGEVTPAKRIPRAIRQFAAVAARVPSARLLIAGSVVDHYDPAADARSCGVEDRVTIAGHVPNEEVADYLEAADVCLCLRWPTSRETSAGWLRCIAAGRPTIVTDLAHTAHVPAYDPRGWAVVRTPARRTDAAGWPVPDEPVCVSIDLLDEDHSLQLAMQRLATDAPFRLRLGHDARAYWSERHTLAGMVSAYVTLLDAALTAPMPDPAAVAALPAHFRSDGTEHASRLLQTMGLDETAIAALWTGERSRR